MRQLPSGSSTRSAAPVRVDHLVRDLVPAQYLVQPEPVLRKEKSPGFTGALEREKGLEPSTSTLARLHSTTELLPRNCWALTYRTPRSLSRRGPKISTSTLRA